MSTIEEKRVYGDATGATEVVVATDAGVAVVEVSGDLVGEFGLGHRCVARDVAAEGRLAVATDEDVLLGDSGGGGFESTGFGPAVAVGFYDGPLAASPGGEVARYADGEGWTVLGTAGDIRAIDGDMVATADGVYRLGDGLVHVGLEDAHDVSTVGVPLAATGRGLYRLGNGWMDALAGDFRVASAGGQGRAHAATPDVLFERTEGSWREREVPADRPIVDVAYGEATYAVTTDGTFLADAGEGWRTRSLGLPDVAALAVL